MTDLRQSTPSNVAFVPPQINSLDDTGLSPLWLQELVLKVLYSRGYMTGFKISEEIALPMAGVTDQLLAALKQEKYIEVKSAQSGLGRACTLTALRAQEFNTRAKRWNAVSMRDRRRCLLKFITKRFAARKADV